MQQFRDLSDNRLISGCIYCGGVANTREHVPSRVFLEKPYPENLPVIGACDVCNNSFSIDEEYFACLLECALVGSTHPSDIKSSSIARALQRNNGLRNRIENSREEIDEQVIFYPEEDRVRRIVLKLAKGHAAFELSQIPNREPDHLLVFTLNSLEDPDKFNQPHTLQIYGEIGSRNMQRLSVYQIAVENPIPFLPSTKSVIVNNWVEVQPDRYRYIAIHDVGGIVIRIVFSEFLACEVIWEDE